MRVAPLRAIGIFLLAYLTITAVAIGTYIGIAGLMGVSISQSMSSYSSTSGKSLLSVTGYSEAQRFFPLENLLVWSLFAWVYYKGCRLDNAKNALPLAFIWAVTAILFDFLLAVALPILLDHPKWLEFYAASPYSFYIEQAPWIYLIYLAIFTAPFAYYVIRLKR
jgi:hypothetical protein